MPPQAVSLPQIRLAVLALFAINGWLYPPWALRAQALEITGPALAQDRYEDHKGSPYLFDEEVVGVATVSGGLTTSPARMNYNGFTEEWEVARGPEHVALDPRDYSRVIVYDGTDTLLFVKGPRPNHPRKFVQVLYRGARAGLYKAFVVSEGESAVQNVGKTETFLNFRPNPLYFLSLDGRPPTLVQLRRRRFLRELAEGGDAADLGKVWKAAGGDDEARAVAVLAARHGG